MDPEYFATIERAFRERAGGLVFGSTDARLILDWGRAGIPLEVVLAGLEAGFERPRGRPIQKLKQLQADVEAAAKRWSTRRVGQHVPAESQSVAAVLVALRDRFAGRADDPDPVVRQVVREATAGLTAYAEMARTGGLVDPVEMLDSLAGQLAESALRVAGPAEAKAVRAHVGDADGPRLWRAIRIRYQLPALVIDVGGGW